MSCKLYGKDVFFEDLIIDPMDWDMWSYDIHYHNLKTAIFFLIKSDFSDWIKWLTAMNIKPDVKKKCLPTLKDEIKLDLSLSKGIWKYCAERKEERQVKG